MRLSLVAAVAANGVIGADREMPWHYPEDLAHFRETTVGHPVVMGRRTFESIAADLGGPLPDRQSIVLTSRPESLSDTVTAVSSLSEALEAVRAHDAETAYVVGGGSVYRQFLPEADELVLTELDEPYEGDTTFPTVDWDRWRVAERERYDLFDIVRYVPNQG
ncbi:dihydrofolate reductase [Haloarcula sp. S1CR25-12]|uniref:dihydrofolate reductase n=1 Tax=Haloarcula saliterrae TaxID=2950534 RepID=A0ABU2FFW8_9EURY|nr:dihydrofolate reductase [Haloarcula sp. S1CR25-12]MDS0261152.1 dihydrofolate reductase [Haloarcula sp. S1CR25-12]